MHVQEVPHEVVQTTKCYSVTLRKNATLFPSSLLIVTTLPVLYCNSRGCNRKLLRRLFYRTVKVRRNLCVSLTWQCYHIHYDSTYRETPGQRKVKTIGNSYCYVCVTSRTAYVSDSNRKQEKPHYYYYYYYYYYY